MLLNPYRLIDMRKKGELHVCIAVIIMKLSSHLSWQIFGDTLVIINEINEEITELNETAMELWFLLNKGYKFDEVVKLLHDKYEDIPLADIAHDYLVIFEQLLLMGYIYNESP